MRLIEALLLGFIQGVTEFLPVSSSGHLVLARVIIGLEDIPLLFDVLLHVSTLAAVVLVFRRRIFSILGSLRRFLLRKTLASDAENLRLTVVVIGASLCTAVVGGGLSLVDIDQHPKIVSALFIVTGLILLATRFAKGTRGYDKAGVKQTLVTGIAQGLGVLPGISRSGITISAALFTGMDREKAGEFSFLIAIPAIIGALALELRQTGDLMAVVPPAVLGVGIAAAFISGLASLLLLLRLIRSGKLYLFCIYLIPLGIAGIILI